ncbi:MAG: CDP-alcohol phosphatidyltransferase family protein [Ignavibacteriae bacterium]|nr:CDP-alcohol phosphatidyltransferase family protein [Ignavibacteriota bacterium]
MPRLHPVEFFKQSLKSQSYYADELINIYLLRPLAAVIVWILYPMSITPNHVTIVAVVVGLIAAFAYMQNTPTAIAIAGLLIVAKDILDDADGQLARAKELYSRRGRFLDSIGDVVVNAALFGAITSVVYQTHPSSMTILLGVLSLLGITLRVSYHVYYQVSFFHLEDQYKLNRIIEEITEEDRKGDPVALRLQQIFLIIYGWQDRLMYRIDQWCMGNKFFLKSPIPNLQSSISGEWYSDRFGLRLSGLLGFGTEFMLLAVCSWLNELYAYLFLNVFLMNGIWMVSVLFRKLVLRKNLECGGAR